MAKLKFIATVGLSFSGKSTWGVEKAKELGNCVIITKDDIRKDMGADLVKGIRVKEGKVIEKRNEMIMEALKKGQNILSLDTNFSTKVDHIANMKALVYPKYREQYDFEVKDFTSVPLDEILERVSKTDRPEGAEYWKRVVMEQKNTYLVPRKLYTEVGYWDNSSMKHCIIADMDGTTSLMPERDGKRFGRSPYEENRANEDLPNAPMVDILKMYASMPEVEVIILSGRREDLGREATEQWLNAHGIKYDHLFMRKANDSRSDVIVKDEIFKAEIEGKYHVRAVFDDRPVVVELWVSKGLPIFAFGNPYNHF